MSKVNSGTKSVSHALEYRSKPRLARRKLQMLQNGVTPRAPTGSLKSRPWGRFLLACVLLAGCDAAPDAQAQPRAEQNPSILPVLRKSPHPILPEAQLGVKDQGIFEDLDHRLQIKLSVAAKGGEVWALHDPARGLLTVYQADWPLKIYPTKAKGSVLRRELGLPLRAGDYQELKKHLTADRVKTLSKGEKPKPGDADGDGIADPLDLLLGAHKTVLNGANYGGGYRRISYPNGDIPREDGVCTDVVVRAVRNIGLDIQKDLQEDIKRRPRAFPMVKKRNANIDHRRVKTLLPYFLKKWDLRSGDLDDQVDPWRPGDIVFMDTFPNRKGPDHIGVLSNTVAPSGQLMVINNWTNGFSTSEMDLLGQIPVTHRFRVKSGK